MVARSSAEAEFRAVAHGICEIMWIRRLLEELKATKLAPMKLYCDNKAAISIAHNLVVVQILLNSQVHESIVI